MGHAVCSRRGGDPCGRVELPGSAGSGEQGGKPRRPPRNHARSGESVPPASRVVVFTSVEMPFVELAAGSTFGGRYRVLRRLASGGMGAVYEVVHLETARRRALKVMLPDLLGNGALCDRFRHEARVTADVQSEFLVDVFDAGVDAATGMPFLVMELLIGEELGRRVERLGPLPAEEVVAHLTQVASALDKTHASSIVHRDLKPANLFFAPREDGSSRVKILDFGISKIVSEASSNGITNRSLGTPAYMSPEQLLGEPVSRSTDIHALGLIAYTLLVGRSYWQDDVESVDNVFAFALRAQSGPKESAGARAERQGRTLPVGFDAWFERATHRDPAARFASASLAASALAAALGVEPGVVAAAPASGQGDAASTFAAPLPVEPRPARFRRQVWVVLVSLAVAVVAAAVLRSRHDEPVAAAPSVLPRPANASNPANAEAELSVAVKLPDAVPELAESVTPAGAVNGAARPSSSQLLPKKRAFPSAAGAPPVTTAAASAVPAVGTGLEKPHRHTRD